MLAKMMDIHEAQTHFFDLVKTVSGGTEVILTQNKKPLMRLVPMTSQTSAGVAEPIIATTLLDEEERDAWSTLAQAGLNAAYSDDEPEYTLSMIKEPNPTYAGG